jgi:hypothetical protein
MVFASTSMVEACTTYADGPEVNGTPEMTGAPMEGGGTEDADGIDVEVMAALDAEDMAPVNPDTRLLEPGECLRN